MPDAQNSEPANTASAPPSAEDSTAVPEHAIATGTFCFRAPGAPDELGTIGPYRIVKELGRGGMGAVYLAVDTRLDRELALKVMLPAFAADPASKERFLREAKAVAKVSHDHVVTIFEADERDGVLYIAMQFLQGAPLDEHLKKKGSPPLAHCVRIVREAALGLAAAHARGLVHRDIKPANLWLEAPNGRVKVLDFGLAKPLSDEVELTKSGVVVGTPAYMSPEQARGSKVDHRTDIFSLGVVLYKLLTGRNPFVGDHTAAVLTALAVDEPTPVRELNPNVPEPLADLVHQLLAKKPEARPQSAAEVAERLSTVLSQPAVVPVHATAPERGSDDLTADYEDSNRTEREADPPREPDAAPKRGKGLLIAGALVLVAVVCVALALGTGSKKPDDLVKNDPPPAPPKKEPDKPAPQPPAPKVIDNPNAPWAAGRSPVEVCALKGYDGAVGSATFAPDGTRIVTAGWDNTAKVWELPTGKPGGAPTATEVLTLKGHKDFVLSAAYSPDGARIVTSSADSTAKVWDAKTGVELFALKGHSGFVLTAAFNSDGTRIVTASTDQTAKVWEVPAGKPGGAKGATAVLTLNGHTDGVTSAAFNSDGARIVTASKDKTAKVWDAQTGAELFAFKGHTESVTSATFGAGGTRVVTSSVDQTAKVWEVPAGKPEGAKGPTELFALKGHTSFVSCAVFNTEGTRIVTASADSTARVWDARTGAELCELKGHAGFVNAAGFSPDGTRIVTAGADKTAKVWEARPSAP